MAKRRLVDGLFIDLAGEKQVAVHKLQQLDGSNEDGVALAFKTPAEPGDAKRCQLRARTRRSKDGRVETRVCLSTEAAQALMVLLARQVPLSVAQMVAVAGEEFALAAGGDESGPTAEGGSDA
jgi:hypothetical protein